MGKLYAFRDVARGLMESTKQKWFDGMEFFFRNRLHVAKGFSLEKSPRTSLHDAARVVKKQTKEKVGIHLHRVAKAVPLTCAPFFLKGGFIQAKMVRLQSARRLLIKKSGL